MLLEFWVNIIPASGLGVDGGMYVFVVEVGIRMNAANI